MDGLPLMLFKNLRKLVEVEEAPDDIQYEEIEEDEYEKEEIKETIEELTDAVSSMKEIVADLIKNEKQQEIEEDEDAIQMATKIFQSHLKISWDTTKTQDVLPSLRSFEKIQNHMKEINYRFVHLEISEFRYELLRNILVSKLVFLIRRILYKVY